jgi:hypothetical protein
MLQDYTLCFPKGWSSQSSFVFILVFKTFRPAADDALDNTGWYGAATVGLEAS